MRRPDGGVVQTFHAVVDLTTGHAIGQVQLELGVHLLERSPFGHVVGVVGVFAKDADGFHREKRKHKNHKTHNAKEARM